MKEYLYRGARSLNEIMKQNLTGFILSWDKAKNMKIPLTSTNDPDYKSYLSLLRHVFNANRRHYLWICEKLEITPENEFEYIDAELSKDFLVKYIEQIYNSWTQLLSNILMDKFFDNEYDCYFGPKMGIEAMLEHAAIHPLRHKFQIDEWIIEHQTNKENTERQIASSIDAESKILKYIPFLLQDLWSLGCDPYSLLELLKNNIALNDKTKVLELCCGKGAALIPIAKEFGINCTGVDAFEPFIIDAAIKAKEFDVENKCNFIIDNYLNYIKNSSEIFDIIIIGSGYLEISLVELLESLKIILNSNGYIVLDSGYTAKDTSDKYKSRQSLFSSITEAGFEVIAENIFDGEKMKKINDYNTFFIKKRALELSEKYPDLKEQFLNYVKSQENESEILENKIIVTELLLKQKI